MHPMPRRGKGLRMKKSISKRIAKVAGKRARIVTGELVVNEADLIRYDLALMNSVFAACIETGMLPATQ
jgi:hypothetical protein